ncbi:glycosyltransferase [Paradesertivirga mongoliensis]|uniref:Glycosyltransferase n=1 Tax=Paradesertivirga mongoliensis TaxID=2100740 RepID=A0ABW4ZHP0_9SPHI|nr:glycosyltransferase [Pedobacter mongoliensis]
MDPGIPVPPPLYGGHERLVAMFIDEYTRLGHDVTLLAGPDSLAPRVKHFGINNLERSGLQKFIELTQAWSYLIQNHKHFDLIHNFGRLLYLLPILNKPVHKFMTYGRDVTNSGIKNITALPHKNLTFTGCSNYCVSTGNKWGKWETVYNAIDFSKYSFKSQVEPDAPLMFLGRIEEIKGPHTAIKVAKATGNKLWIAGNIAKQHIPYFEREIKPHIDNEQITYLGPLNDFQKDEFLGKAKALLFPIEWDEPFGMVMVEAMACGTPVIAIKRGSVDEVIDQGLTGFKATTINDIIPAIANISGIDRAKCREQASKRFDVKVIARRYLSLINK